MHECETTKSLYMLKETSSENRSNHTFPKQQTLIKYEVLKPCGEELTRWREASFWRNRRPGPGQKCEHVRVRLRGYLQAVRNRK